MSDPVLKDFIASKLMPRIWELEDEVAELKRKLTLEEDKRLDAEATLSEMQVDEVEAHLYIGASS